MLQRPGHSRRPCGDAAFDACGGWKGPDFVTGDGSDQTHRPWPTAFCARTHGRRHTLGRRRRHHRPFSEPRHGSIIRSHAASAAHALKELCVVRHEALEGSGVL